MVAIAEAGRVTGRPGCDLKMVPDMVEGMRTAFGWR